MYLNSISNTCFFCFYFVGCLFLGLHILCVKMKTSICEESVLRLNKRNCFPSYQHHYLMQKCCQPKQDDPILEFSGFAIGRVIFGQRHICASDLGSITSHCLGKRGGNRAYF